MDIAYRDFTDHSKRPFRAQRDGRKLRTEDGKIRKFATLKAANAALRRSQP